MLQGLNEDLAFPLLLRRPQIVSGQQSLASVTGKRVMVTGAGGSIGSELSLQIAALNPAALVLVDHSEFNLYEVNCTLAEAALPFRPFPAVADVRSRRAMHHLFREHRPDIVFHAAALKHVALLENDHNLIEAVLTNIAGSIEVAEACAASGARMVFISTDKAVEPASVMGLTKRVAELALAYTAHSRCSPMQLSIVRFGNVLGSSGSVVPLFRRQIAQGGPVTVTHPDMTRYLMTIREAIGLVLQSTVALLDERNPALPVRLYVLDMGKPVRIIELARQLIEMAGLRPGEDIRIEIIGVRPGEKLIEQLAYPHEHLVKTDCRGILGATLPRPDDRVRGLVFSLLIAAGDRNIEQVKSLMLELVPDFQGRDVWK